ncbi:hypothetical protein V6N12_042665 [Hibiscus sabdariffa]|uniref:Uncharacterized protein n=1 Tax=Hibiscus sabdariffa TaxID=183260 RepID=A0ABR2ALJ2_9ROSI
MASGNMLRFQPNPSWIPPFQCEIIGLGQWHLGPKFPQWLKSQMNLSYLDISHAEISDVVPTWFLNLSSQLYHANLSSNDLTGGISYLNVTSYVDLSSNRFTGLLPRVLPTLAVLVLSNNSFSGSLHELVCNSSERRAMMILDIVLNLRNNNMFGELPSALQNCKSLIILDLSENHFSRSVPAWMGDKLSRLEVLRLRSNKLDGHIPHKICALQYLQNLDLAHNNISGAIPKCFSNFSAMVTKAKIFNYLASFGFGDEQLHPSASLVLKGRQDEYSSTLRLVTSLDLSANSLTGEISKELGTLTGLLSLNLS